MIGAAVAGNGLLNGLVSYWKLDESSGNALDAHGSNDGTVTSATQGSTGKINTSYYFNGLGYITIGDILSGPTAFSISVWFIKDNTNGEFLINKGIGLGTEREYLLAYDNADGKMFVTFYDETNDTSTVTKANSAITADGATWHHLVMTWDGSTVTFYLNGSNDGGGANSEVIRNTSSNFAICWDEHPSLQRYWTGKVDEIGIWNRELTSDDITTLYNSGNGLSYDNFTT